MEKGHKTIATNRHRFVPIHSIAKVLGKHVCDGLLAFHALTGCDTTSSFFKIEKKSAWQIYFKNIKDFGLQCFGKASLEESLIAARKLVSSLYRENKCKDLDQIRIKLTQGTNRSAKELPPTEDSFYLHVQRYRYLLYTTYKCFCNVL